LSPDLCDSSRESSSELEEDELEEESSELEEESSELEEESSELEEEDLEEDTLLCNSRSTTNKTPTKAFIV